MINFLARFILVVVWFDMFLLKDSLQPSLEGIKDVVFSPLHPMAGPALLIK